MKFDTLCMPKCNSVTSQGLHFINLWQWHDDDDDNDDDDDDDDDGDNKGLEASDSVMRETWKEAIKFQLAAIMVKTVELAAWTDHCILIPVWMIGV